MGFTVTGNMSKKARYLSLVYLLPFIMGIVSLSGLAVAETNGKQSREVWNHCDDDAFVVLHTIQGGGHTWPGSGPWDPEGVQATTEIWTFFEQHPQEGSQP